MHLLLDLPCDYSLKLKNKKKEAHASFFASRTVVFTLQPPRDFQQAFFEYRVVLENIQQTLN